MQSMVACSDGDCEYCRINESALHCPDSERKNKEQLK